LLLGIAAYLIVGANRPANPQLVPPQGVVKETTFRAFDTVSFTVTPGSGGPPYGRTRCALLARTSAQQAVGLKGQTSLDGFAGMVFQFQQPTDQAFYMKDTPMPLTIAWFDVQGAFIGALDMTPCRPDQLCPDYRAGRTYEFAVEVPQGRLASLAIGPGAVLHLSGPCVG
jgi:uncharacterized membrane protein (UPF0127 family)